MASMIFVALASTPISTVFSTPWEVTSIFNSLQKTMDIWFGFRAKDMIAEPRNSLLTSRLSTPYHYVERRLKY
jgi:hypothetical protein